MRQIVIAGLILVVGCTPCPNKDLVCNYQACLPSSNVHDDDRERCEKLAHDRAEQK